MKLWQTRRHWNKFATTDPLWAVMTAPEKKGNRWAVEEFFATGQQEVNRVMEIVSAHCQTFQRERALDFGCGPGRLTQALALHFQHVTGIDISAPMLELAQKYNRCGARATFAHNTRPDLAVFADGSFDFVLSMITLQHVEPAYARRYIAEFVRVLAPGGVAFFQVPYQLPKGRNESPHPSPGPTASRMRIDRITLRKIRQLKRFLNRIFVLEPVMEMHAVPRDEVVGLVCGAGGEVLDVSEHPGSGQECRSYAYLIRKR